MYSIALILNRALLDDSVQTGMHHHLRYSWTRSGIGNMLLIGFDDPFILLNSELHIFNNVYMKLS